jgi:hypothetical protein
MIVLSLQVRNLKKVFNLKNHFKQKNYKGLKVAKMHLNAIHFVEYH